MSISHTQLREQFAQFWKQKEHVLVPPSPLVLKEDPTTLFNSSGMQPLVPFLLGETHALGKRLYNIQPCIRTQDIEEVGNNRHTTFFEMMGNWSLDDYFKEEQHSWCWEFYTKIIGLPKDKLYVTVFEGGAGVPKDEESIAIWKKLGVAEDHIRAYGADKNWWSRSGPPEKMPVGEIGGPDSEIFYEFENVQHDKKFGETCHPNCDCGRFMEFANSVFIQYRKKEDGSLEELSQKNVDFGGGLERLSCAANNQPDVFKTDIFTQIIRAIEEVSQKPYEENKQTMRIIADHVRASVFLTKNGVYPSNKEHGYVLRKFLRRACVKMRSLNGSFNKEAFSMIARAVLSTYGNKFFDITTDEITISKVVDEEIKKFVKSLDLGMKELSKYQTIDGKIAFDLYQSFGFPLEVTEELLKEKGKTINHDDFEKEFNKHKELSRSASTGMFTGGLADQGEQTIKYHTATHLLHQALYDVLGQEVRQEGSNITTERLRFDFQSTTKPTDEQVKKIETTINEKINASLPVSFKILPKEEALKVGAKSFFREKYPERVKVYFIGNSLETAYSKEFCGGPHVANTKEIGKITIYKTEKIGSNLYRIYAK